MNIQHLMIGLLATGCIIGIVGFYGDLGSKYGVAATENLSTISKYNETASFINQTYEDITNTTTLFTGTPLGPFIDPIAAAIKGIIDIFMTFTQIPSYYSALISDISMAFAGAGIPIPAWFLGIISGIILIVIIFAIINLIRGGSKVE